SVTLDLQPRFDRRGPEGPAARGEGFGGDGLRGGISALVGARDGAARAAGRLEPAPAALGRVALIPPTGLRLLAPLWLHLLLGLLALIVLNLLLGLSLGDRGLFGWGVGGLAVWCAIACWRSRGARAGSPANPLPSL